MNALKSGKEDIPYVRRPKRSRRKRNRKAEAQPTMGEITRKGRTWRGIALARLAQKIINAIIQRKG
jgi:ribosome-binding protein aMBF1 (putative translation factor)